MPNSLRTFRAPRWVALRRNLTDRAVTLIAAVMVVLVVAPLLAIFTYLVLRGMGSLNLDFFTKVPVPVGEKGGGMANAIVGSGLILLIGSLIGVPLGIGAGIYLSEYGGARFASVLRFTADVLNGVPSIVIGIVAYGLVVLRQRHFSALSGGVALGILMIPTVTRTTEEVLLMVPLSVRVLDEVVERSLRLAALWDEVKDVLHKQSGASLSGGQQQRLCIARSLAVEPEVMLMDEPASALDPISTAKIEDLIFQLKERYTIVIVTHNMQQAARVAEFTGFFLMGKLIEFDKTEKIFTNPSDKRTEDYITGRFG